MESGTPVRFREYALGLGLRRAHHHLYQHVDSRVAMVGAGAVDQGEPGLRRDHGLPVRPDLVTAVAQAG